MSRWTAWQTLRPSVTFTEDSLRETLDEGQAFRWHAREAGTWEGFWNCHHVQMRCGKDGKLQWRKPIGNTTDSTDVAQYFDAKRDYASILDALPWRSDPVLRQALSLFPGMRILRQSPGEALLVFLCSATKRIPQIKQVCTTLAEAHGTPISDGQAHALPDWETLARLPEATLRESGMGFRARNIHACALRLAEEPDWLDTTASLPYAEARTRLLGLPGVGEKIADCVLLYGMNRLESFPVDTWINQAMQRLYHLNGWTHSQIAHFGRTHFGAFAGLAQQFLFAAVRRRKL